VLDGFSPRARFLTVAFPANSVVLSWFDYEEKRDVSGTPERERLLPQVSPDVSLTHREQHRSGDGGGFTRDRSWRHNPHCGTTNGTPPRRDGMEMWIPLKPSDATASKER
jgi:hypothetical protein